MKPKFRIHKTKKHGENMDSVQWCAMTRGDRSSHTEFEDAKYPVAYCMQEWVREHGKSEKPEHIVIGYLDKHFTALHITDSRWLSILAILKTPRKLQKLVFAWIKQSRTKVELEDEETPSIEDEWGHTPEDMVIKVFPRLVVATDDTSKFYSAWDIRNPIHTHHMHIDRETVVKLVKHQSILCHMDEAMTVDYVQPAIEDQEWHDAFKTDIAIWQVNIRAGVWKAHPVDAYLKITKPPPFEFIPKG